MKNNKAFLKRSASMIVLVAILANLLFVPNVFAARTYDASVYISGSQVGFVDPAYELNGVIYVPLEEICDYLNIKCEKQSDDTFKLTRGKSTVILQNGNMICKLNGKSVILSGHPKTKNDKVFIPIDLMDVCFGMPLQLDATTHYAELQPNIYKVFITEQNAAAVERNSPTVDVLKKGDKENDKLYTYEPMGSQNEQSIFYKFDLSDFEGKKIKAANLVVTAGRGGNWYPHIELERTKNWEKSSINYNNQPGLTGDARIVGSNFGEKYEVNATTMFPNILPVTLWATSSIEAKEPLCIKMLGVPHSSASNPTAPQVYIRGVNTPEKAYLEIELDEVYEFPIAKEERVTDVERNAFGTLSFFKKIGVIHEGEEFPSDLSESITRAEFVRYAVRTFGADINLGDTEPIFADVQKNSPYFKEVALAVSLKLVSGDNGGYFRPDDAITYNEAVTIACRMVGYSMYANNNGGYPGGYIAAAQKGKLLRNIKFTDGFGFDSAFELLLNTLGAPIFDATSYDSNGGAQYSFLENETLLSRYWDAYKFEGRITGNEFTNVDSTKSGNGNQLTIEDKTVFIDNQEYNNLLGYYAVVYCTKEDDKVLYIGTDADKDDIEKVDFADINEVEDGTSSLTIHYIKDESRSRTEEISKAAWVIYNGKTVPQDKITKKLFEAETGNIVIINNDIVIITAYTTVVVNSVDLINELIVDEYDAYDKAIRLKDADYYAFRDETGYSVPFETIKKSDVLSLAISLDKKLIVGEISRRAITAKLGSIDGKGTEDCSITINGGEYKLINQYSKWTDLISFDKTGTYLIDVFGNVAGYINLESQDNFGYILAISQQRGLSGTVEAAINVSDSETYVKYEFADRVNIDGESFKDAEKIVNYFKDSATNETKKQGIIFRVNSDKKINRIDTVTLGDNEDIETSLCLRYQADMGQLMYKSGRLGDLYFVDLESALTVCAPDNATSLDEYESIKEGIGNEDSINVDVYTLGNRTPSADILILKNYGVATSVGEFAQLSLVSGIRTALNEDGDVVKKLYLYNASTNEISVDVEQDKLSLLDGINPGDLVRIGSDRKNQLVAITKYYDYESRQIVDNSRYDTSYFNHNVRVYGGYVIDKINQFVKFSKDLDDTREESYRWYNFEDVTKLYKYNVLRSGDVQISKATVNDMIDYEHVPFAPSGIILQTRYATQYICGYVIEMGKPANTGIYKIEFEAGNGGSGTAPTFIRADIGDEITLPGNSFVRDEYDFAGWLSNKDGHVYQPGDTYVVTGESVFSAQWTYVGKQYTISFTGGDGATGTMTDLKSSAGKTVSLPENSFRKAGGVFVGWSDGTHEYQPGDSYTVPEYDVNFEAIWFSCWDGTASETAPETTEISGNTYYQISNGNDLAWFANEVNSGNTTINAVLTDDISLNFGEDYSNNWYPYAIGNSSGKKFAGIFDGANHTIYGLYSEDEYAYQGGLFGYIGTEGTVKNLILKDVKIATSLSTTQVWAGAIAAQNEGAIRNCSAYGEIVAVDNGILDGVGGLVGELCNGTVSDCYSEMNIISEAGYDSTSQASVNNSGVGGIVAKAKDAFVIERCGNGGTINVPKLYQVGGIIGKVDSTTGTYSECYNTGNITGGWRVAGIVGFSNNSAVIATSLYNTGNIEAKNTYAAGLHNNAKEKGGESHASYSIGIVKAAEDKKNYSGLLYTYDSSYEYNHFDQNFIYVSPVTEGTDWTIGRVTCGGGQGAFRGTAKTLEEIKTQATVDILNGWTGMETYKIDESINNGYPVFNWQY